MENKFVRRADNLLTRYLPMCAFMQMADEIIVCGQRAHRGFTGTAPRGRDRQTQMERRRIRRGFELQGLKSCSQGAADRSFSPLNLIEEHPHEKVIFVGHDSKSFSFFQTLKEHEILTTQYTGFSEEPLAKIQAQSVLVKHIFREESVQIQHQHQFLSNSFFISFV